MNDIEKLEQKYIKLLLNRCINFKKSKSLFIHYIKENKEFIDKLANEARKLGIEDIYFDEENLEKTHELLNNLSVDEIKINDYFKCNHWDLYAKKNASFLIAESYVPDLMNDIAEEKIAVSNYIKASTKPIYKSLQNTNEIPWCIFCLPNKLWADMIFPNKENSYELLYKVILDMCMIDDNDPIENWNKFIIESTNKTNLLNVMKIKSLHYKNELGTDLYIELMKDSKWEGVGTDEEDMLVNMPSYEIFTSPNYKKTNGIVYNTRPLIYNGVVIDNFYLEFKDGKVINYDAKSGKEVLKGIIESDDHSCFLGEVALVPYDSPISNTNLVFYETLFDENASCHLALGDAFKTVVKDYQRYSDEELDEMGLNKSKTHVDFMIGSKDLIIEAETEDGTISIFKDGNFVI